MKNASLPTLFGNNQLNRPLERASSEPLITNASQSSEQPQALFLSHSLSFSKPPRAPRWLELLKVSMAADSNSFYFSEAITKLCGKAKFTGTSTPIKSDALSTYWLSQRMLELKVDYPKLSSSKQIAKLIKPGILDQHKALIGSSEVSYSVPIENWAAHLVKTFTAMQLQPGQAGANKRTLKHLFICDGDYIMAAELRIENRDGQKPFRVFFYDPESTNQRRIVEVDRSEELSGKTFQDFFYDRTLAPEYGPDSDAVLTIYETRLDSEMRQKLTQSA